MPNQNYAKEVGLDTGERRISWPITIVIIAVLAVAGWFLAKKVNPGHETEVVPAVQGV